MPEPVPSSLPGPSAPEAGDACPTAADDAELQDPIAGVVSAELSRRFVRLCLSWAEPMITDLASQEAMLRQDGGPELAQRMLANRLYQRIDPEVFRLLRVAVPLADARGVFDRVEDLLRHQFGTVVATAISYLLSHDRDVAIQMLAVAVTMAGREVMSDVSTSIAMTREAPME